MKTYIYCVLLFILFGCSVNCQGRNIDLSSYNFEVSYQKLSQMLSVNLICSFRVLSSTDSIVFVFSNNSKIKSIKLRERSGWKNVGYRFNTSDSLIVYSTIKLDTAFVYELKFDYLFPTGRFNDTMLMVDRGDRWYPLIMDQIVPFKLYCHVSKGLSVISAGNLVTEQSQGDNDLFVWESKMAVFKLPLIIYNPSRYTESVLNKGKQKICLFTMGRDSLGVSTVLRITYNAMNYFDSSLGDYSYKNLTLLEVNDFPGIDIASGLLTIGTESLKEIEGGFDDILLLSVAEQWFGACVFGEYGAPGFFFFNISLPHYLRLMYVRHSRGKEIFNKSIMRSFDSYKPIAGTDVDVPLLDIQPSINRNKGLILFGKGPYILSKLENEIGTTEWLKFLRDLYSSYQGKILTYRDFRAILAGHVKNNRTLIGLENMLGEKGIPEK